MTKKSVTVDFLISPSESLLLGLCLGEYLAYHEQPQWPKKKYFIKVLCDRLKPHVPPFRHLRKITVSHKDLPDDIEWPEEHESCGFSKTEPSRLFRRRPEGCTAEEWDTSRNSLFDWLVILLGKHMSLRLYDRLLYPPERLPKYGVFYRALLKAVKTDQPVFEREGDEGSQEASEIKTLVERLARDSDCQHTFDIGKLFGRLIFEIDEFESYVWNVDDEEEQWKAEARCLRQQDLDQRAADAVESELRNWTGDQVENLSPELSEEERKQWLEMLPSKIAEKRDELIAESFELVDDDWEPDELFDATKSAALNESIRTLLETDVIRHCYHAEVILKTLLKPTNVPKFSSEGMGQESRFAAQLSSLSQITYARMAFWLAFGEVLGVFRDADAERKLKDAKIAVSRSFKLLPADNPERVYERLLRVEAELNEAPDAAGLPENTVAMLAPVIEALAKRVWPEEFMPPNWNGQLGSVLHGKLSSTNPLEQRFASLSMTLHKQYRNPAMHDFDSFSCSFEEARLFVAGIRVLLDLWGRLQR